jgi:hypothetical protein
MLSKCLGDTRTYRVIMTRTEPGFLTTDGKGETAEEAYNNALRNFDEMAGEKPRKTPAAPTEWGANNTVFSKERADREVALLAAVGLLPHKHFSLWGRGKASNKGHTQALRHLRMPFFRLTSIWVSNYHVKID